SALEVSILTISPAGMEARTILAHSMPGRLMSKVYLARPVTLAGPSRRGWRPFTTRSFESRSQGLRAPSATLTSRVWGEEAWPTLTVCLTVGTGGGEGGGCWGMAHPLRFPADALAAFCTASKTRG